MKHGNAYDVMSPQPKKFLEFTRLWAHCCCTGQWVMWRETRGLLRLTLPYARAMLTRPIGFVYVFCAHEPWSIETETKKTLQSPLTSVRVFFVLASTKIKQNARQHGTGRYRQRQICFFVFGFILIFETLRLSLSKSVQVVVALRACLLPQTIVAFQLA